MKDIILRKYHIIIPIIQFTIFSSYALFLTLSKFNTHLSDLFFFFRAGTTILNNPIDLYINSSNNSHTGYYYLPSFACVMIIFIYLPFGIARLILFLLIYFAFIIIIFEFEKIISIKIVKQARKLLFL
ncbi:MAG: hypothetical protein ACTSRI_15635, partial [Promethearchaeota archaeon]